MSAEKIKSLGTSSRDDSYEDGTLFRANGITPLMIAAQTGNKEAVEKVLAREGTNAAYVRAQNKCGFNALMLAAEAGYQSIVQILHEYDVKYCETGITNRMVRQKTKYGQTALMLAIEHCEDFIFKEKIDAKREGDTPLPDWLAVISYIVKDLNAPGDEKKEESRWQLMEQNKFEKWSFMIAAEFQQLKVVEWMLDNVPKIISDESVVKDLISKKNIERGNNCLMMACTGDPLNENGVKIVEKLLEKDPDGVTVVNNFGDTPLIYAIAKFNPKLSIDQADLATRFKLLMKTKEITPNTLLGVKKREEDNGFTPLMRAAEFGQMACVDVLLEWRDEKDKKYLDLHKEWEDAEPDKKKRNRRSPLHIAFLNGHVALATKCFMKDGETNSKVKDLGFTDDELLDMARRYSATASNESNAHRSIARARIAAASAASILPEKKNRNIKLGELQICRDIGLIAESSLKAINELVHHTRLQGVGSFLVVHNMQQLPSDYFKNPSLLLIPHYAHIEFDSEGRTVTTAFHERPGVKLTSIPGSPFPYAFLETVDLRKIAWYAVELQTFDLTTKLMSCRLLNCLDPCEYIEGTTIPHISPDYFPTGDTFSFAYDCKYVFAPSPALCRQLKEKLYVQPEEQMQVQPEELDSSMAFVGAYAAVYEFHLDLMLTLIPLAPLCISMLNKALPAFYSGLRYGIKSPFKNNESVISTTNTDLVYKLVRLAAALKMAIVLHPLERADIQERLSKVENMIHIIFRDCDSMDEMSNVRKSLCCAMQQNVESFVDPVVTRAMAFKEGPIVTALENRFSALFSSANVSTYIDKVFWSTLKTKKLNWIERHKSLAEFVENVLAFFSPTRKEALNILRLKSNLSNCRYSPAFMFFAEGVSHAITCFLICWILLTTYDPNDYDSVNDRPNVQFEEGFLMAMCLANCLNEFGQLAGDGLTPQIKVNYPHYLSDYWNFFDTCSLALVLLWVVLKFTMDQPFEYVKAALASATIFQAMGLLRYSSFNESFGQFVILIIETVIGLGSFVVVFLITLSGFFVFFLSLYPSNDHFQTPALSLLTLFSGSLNVYDSFTTTFGDEGKLAEIGMAAWVLYIFSSAIVLLNLIVAQLTNTYSRLTEEAFQKWQLARAETVSSYLLIYEKSPFCMLPAPLNLLTVILWPFHYLLVTRKACNEWKQFSDRKSKSYLSLHGTFADILCGIIAAFIAPFYEFILFIWSSIDVWTLDGMFEAFILIMVLFPVIYPIYVMALIVEAISHNRTYISLAQCPEGYKKWEVQYKTRSNYEEPSFADTAQLEGEIVIKINSWRDERISEAADSDRSSFHVRVRVGNYQRETGPAIAIDVKKSKPESTKRDTGSTIGKKHTQEFFILTWSHENLRFPITTKFKNILTSQNSKENELEPVMEITLVARNPVTHDERIMGHRAMGRVEFSGWIINKRFETPGSDPFVLYEKSSLDYERFKSSTKSAGNLGLFVKIQFDIKKFEGSKADASSNVSSPRLRQNTHDSIKALCSCFKSQVRPDSNIQSSMVSSFKRNKTIKDLDRIYNEDELEKMFKSVL